MYENREIIARFPVNDPARPDARIRAEEFAAAPRLWEFLEEMRDPYNEEATLAETIRGFLAKARA